MANRSVSRVAALNRRVVHAATRSPQPRRSGIRAGLALGIGLGAAVAVATAGIGVLSTIIARKIVTPVSAWPDDIQIREVNLTAPAGATITIASDPDTRLPGTYSFWFSANTGHAVLGEIVAADASWVTRAVSHVRGADLSAASRGRLSSFVHQTPADLDTPWDNVEIPTPNGPAPAWIFPAAETGPAWVIHVHGRGTNRQEALRAVPVLFEAGYTSLLISYRNDGDAPASLDGRYGLGDTEWRDVESAIEFAAERGARQIVLMGWSMGGAVVLQSAHRTGHPNLITGLILESPVIDWEDVLNSLGSSMRVPRIVAKTALHLLGRGWARRLTGLDMPIDFSRLNFVTRAAHLRLPTLVMHSDDDGYVPPTGSQALQALRPDLVTLHRFTIARHTKLWNYDPERWNDAIRSWLGSLPSPDSGTTGHN